MSAQLFVVLALLAMIFFVALVVFVAIRLDEAKRIAEQSDGEDGSLYRNFGGTDSE